MLTSAFSVQVLHSYFHSPRPYCKDNNLQYIYTDELPEVQ